MVKHKPKNSQKTIVIGMGILVVVAVIVAGVIVFNQPSEQQVVEGIIGDSGQSNQNVGDVSLYAQPAVCDLQVVEAWWLQARALLDGFSDDIESSTATRDVAVVQQNYADMQANYDDNIAPIVVPSCAPEIVVAEWQLADSTMVSFLAEFAVFSADPVAYSADGSDFYNEYVVPADEELDRIYREVSGIF